MTRKAIAEAYSLFDRATSGDLTAKAKFAESLTTSDFPQLLGKGFNAKLLAAYEGIAPVWQQYSTRIEVQNFKPQTLKQLLGPAGLELVPEATEYPGGDLAETLYEFLVKKYGRRLPLTWEMIVNDELGAFRNLHEVLAFAASEHEGIVTAEALMNGAKSDVNTAFFKSANSNAPESAALDAASLQAAIEAVSQRKTRDGKIVARPHLVLVVPPTLEFKARELLTATEIRRVVGDETIVSQNPLANSLTLVVEPNLLLNTNSKAATTWFVLPAPNPARPALVTGFMSGRTAPDIRVSNDTGNYVGGGSVNPLEGSFEDDTIQYRVRHIVGAAAIDPLHTFVSRGA